MVRAVIEGLRRARGSGWAGTGAGGRRGQGGGGVLGKQRPGARSGETSRSRPWRGGRASKALGGFFLRVEPQSHPQTCACGSAQGSSIRYVMATWEALE